MKKFLFFFFSLFLLASCVDDESYPASDADRLTFSTDTVRMDTVFSNVPTQMRTFWVFNHGSKGLRATVNLKNGSRTGFRVNVDGTYLSEANNYRMANLELRHGDSLRVFVELTAPTNGKTTPQEISDQLNFMLESGVGQSVELSAWAWDARIVDNLVVAHDSTISKGTPLVIRKGMSVDSAATLTLEAGTTLYFSEQAALDVYGTLISKGTAEENVVLRGDRLDRMFTYLPYDLTPGRWQGIRIHSSSFDNHLTYTDIHSTYDGVWCDSSSTDNSKLWLEACTIHNCQGYGLWANNCKIKVENTEISNVLHDCACFLGGEIDLNHVTLAQFYPFDAGRGVALRFSNTTPICLACTNSIITGYDDDELMGEPKDTAKAAFAYRFNNCLLRTPSVTTADSVYFQASVFENVKDTTVAGTKNFAKIDTDLLQYDFVLKPTSLAVGLALPSSALPTDRRGKTRGSKPDAGAFQHEE